MFDSKTFLSGLTTCPGVYQMFDQHQKLIYVGKAKNLKKRVSQYFRKTHDLKTQKMVAQIASISVIVAQSENDALILENNLIKQFHPKYNILFRDDKSYLYILLSHDPFPRLSLYRGKPNKSGDFFGPYPHGTVAKETVDLLQKLFFVRSCKNTFFKSRSRPCLQYQIKRCSAPCVNLISQEDYLKTVKYIRLFLEGKNQIIVDEFVRRMKQASQRLDYELAKQYRDQIQLLREVQQSRRVIRISSEKLDIIAIAQQQDMFCVNVLMVRSGQVLGHRAFFPDHAAYADPSEVLSAFLQQHYLNLMPADMPHEIVTGCRMAHQNVLKQVLSRHANRSVEIKSSVRGIRAEWLEMSLSTAKQALKSRFASNDQWQQKYLSLKDTFNFERLPKRMECFDISHTMGEATVASCVVFGEKGPLNKSYRRYNIKDIQAGDDFAAMNQVLMRRYQKLKLENQSLPDVVIIDGGKGQLTQAIKVFDELQIDDVILMGISKGENRKIGLETIHLAGTKETFKLSENLLAFHLIQHIRDEAHRFAISGHRLQRDQRRRHSSLENIPGVGVKRRRELLTHFGGLQGVLNASVQELTKVSGISQELAKRIYANLHGEL